MLPRDSSQHEKGFLMMRTEHQSRQYAQLWFEGLIVAINMTQDLSSMQLNRLTQAIERYADYVDSGDTLHLDVADQLVRVACRYR